MIRALMFFIIGFGVCFFYLNPEQRSIGPLVDGAKDVINQSATKVEELTRD